LRHSNIVVFCAVDPFLGPRGQTLFGFDKLLEGLANSGVPCVWLTNRTRGQLDEIRRRVEATDPFIAEEGCGVYIPEDYFHLKGAKTIRLGRFLCIPVAQPQPASKDALEALSLESGVMTVPLRSLTPRELAQNTGLAPREADLVRTRDFDEVFFFAGTGDAEIQRFISLGSERELAIRPHGNLWSLAAGANTQQCIRQLAGFYDRALHKKAYRLGIAASKDASSFSPVCDRMIQIASGASRAREEDVQGDKAGRLVLSEPDVWDRVLSAVKSGR
jgi:predicted mannosyl-3-phosphoglycerate phosphatase (HAD superfamily)